MRDIDLERNEKNRRAKLRIGSYQIHNDLYHQYTLENRWTLFGKYYGTPINQLPESYLNWLIKNISGKYKEFAEKELYRRKKS
jgi:type II secretory pathway predicted ATPase ExeA